MSKLSAAEVYIASHDITWPQGRPHGAMCQGPEVPVIKKGTLVRYEPSSGHFFRVDPITCIHNVPCGCDEKRARASVNE